MLLLSYFFAKKSLMFNVMYLIHGNNEVCRFNGGEPMRHHDGSSPGPRPVQGRLDTCLLHKMGSLKVIRKFFLNHNKSFRWHLGDYEKHNFFPI